MAEKKTIAPPLTVDTVLTAVRGVNWRTFGKGIVFHSKVDEIQQRYHSDGERLRRTIEWWVQGDGKDKKPSWRRIICALDGAEEKRLADRIRHFAEPVPDPTLTVEKVAEVMGEVGDRKSVWGLLGVPGSKRADIELQSSTEGEKSHALSQYWVSTHPDASWKDLGIILYACGEERAAVMAKQYLPKADPTLTTDNVMEVVKEVEHRWEELGRKLVVPESKMGNIKSLYQSDRMRMEAVVDYFVKCNPYSSWMMVAGELQEMELHKLADEVTTKHVRGDSVELHTVVGEPTVAVTPTPTSHPEPFKTESMLLFEEAMKQGYIEVCIIKCLLLGTAGVGKTSLLHLLLDMLPPQLRQSTACIEQAIRAICIKCGISGGKWQKVDSGDLCDHLAGSVSKEATSIRDSVDPPPASGASLHHDHERATGSTGPCSNTMEAIVKRVEKEPRLEKLQDMTWVYLVDSGGQPQFHELLTAFVRNALVGVFVHKLSERLDDHPHVQYYDKKGEQCGKGYRSPLSNRDIFQHCIQTVQSLPYTTEDSTCPKLAVVGTHRDEEHQCKGESRNEKNKQLREILRPIRDNVYFCPGMQDVIFPVNAASPDPEDKAIANELRDTIESLKPPPKKVPLKWYGLELELEKEALEKRRWVFTRDECLQVAKRLHFPSDNIEKALDAALEHLDKLSIFLYYPDVLPELLFCSPHVLLDKISELVEESHRMKHGPNPNALIEGKFSRFCNKGMVTAQLLGDYPKHYTEFFTQAHLLKLFESLLIVAPIDHDTYFMPSLLDMLKQSEIHRHCGSCALVILFKDRYATKYAPKYAPLGLFSSLIAFLLSDKSESGSFEIAGDNPKLYRNHITLALCPGPGSVTLINSATFFEVHIVLRTTNLPSLHKDTCRYVSDTIERGLKGAIKTRNFQNICYEKAIPCPCKEGPHTLHPALVRTHTLSGNQIWQCTRAEVCGKLEGHVVWVENHTDTEPYRAESLPTDEGTPPTNRRRTETATEDTHVELGTPPSGVASQPTPKICTPSGSGDITTDMKPRMAQLMRLNTTKGDSLKIIESLIPVWKDVGYLMDLDETGQKVECIEAEHAHKQNGLRICCQKMFMLWLDSPDATWANLIKLLVDSEHRTLAKQVQDALGL